MAKMSWKEYYRVATENPEVLDRVEAELASVAAGRPVRAAELQQKIAPGHPRDMVVRCLWALEKLRAVRRMSDSRFVVEAGAFQDSASARAAVRSALEWSRASANDGLELLVSSPQDSAAAPEYSFTTDLSDLRTAVRSLIAGARETLLLASPFWDIDVASDLGALISRRVEDGVQVHVLTRAAAPGSSASGALALLCDALGDDANSDLRILEVPSRIDPFGAVTFHFKLAVSDRRLAYLGSANFNTAGMASRWELGVLLRGDAAQTLSDLGEALYEAGRSQVDV